MQVFMQDWDSGISVENRLNEELTSIDEIESEITKSRISEITKFNWEGNTCYNIHQRIFIFNLLRFNQLLQASYFKIVNLGLFTRYWERSKDWNWHLSVSCVYTYIWE